MPFDWAALSMIPRTLLASLLRWKPARTRSSVRPRNAPADITFCPLVLEAVGGEWSNALRSVVAWIASESKRSGPVDGTDASFKIAQHISCTLHGRAILKRAPEQVGAPCRSLGISVLAESELAWFLGTRTLYLGGVLPSRPRTSGHGVTVRLPIVLWRQERCGSCPDFVHASWSLIIFFPGPTCGRSVAAEALRFPTGVLVFVLLRGVGLVPLLLSVFASLD